VDPGVRELRWIRHEPETIRQLDADPAQRFLRLDVTIRDDEDEIALRCAGRGSESRRSVVAQELEDR